MSAVAGVTVIKCAPRGVQGFEGAGTEASQQRLGSVCCQGWGQSRGSTFTAGVAQQIPIHERAVLEALTAGRLLLAHISGT